MKRIYCIIFIIISFSPKALAVDYLSASEAIENKNISKNKLEHWQNNILYPHLQEKWLTKNIETISQKTVSKFLNEPNNKAAAWLFTPKWNEELIRRKDWVQISKAFESFNEPLLKCNYFQALLETGQQPLPQDIEQFWLSSQSRPDECDPIFKAWLAEQNTQSQLIWDRQLLAFYGRNKSLLIYLDNLYVDSTDKALSQFLIDVYNQPTAIISKSYDPTSAKMRELALAAVNRMAFQDPRSASNLWSQIVKNTPQMTHKDVREASRYLGIAMAKQALPEASYWLSIADKDKADEDVQHWQLQIALSQKNYLSVTQMYQELSPALQQSSQWLYWYGLSMYKTAGILAPNNPLQALSTQRLYYGYLAAGVLGTEPSLNSTPNYSPVDAASLKKQPELKRAKALYLAGDMLRAQIEWNLWVRDQDDQTQHAAAELALNLGWYAKASQSAGWSGRYDLIHLRYPDAYGPLIEYNAAQLQLPDFWVYGVMRQESRFEQTALSPAGAYGLMQIMPATAKSTAQKHNIPYVDKDDLYKPDTNISIGTHYLNDLLIEFKHPVLATAAYNAGPSRVDLWRERFPNEMTVWIESIPFEETRNYVKSVLAYSQIYAITRNEQWNMASWTVPAEIVAKQ